MKTIIVSYLTVFAWISFGASNPISLPQCTPGSVFMVDCNWCYCKSNRVVVCTLVACQQADQTEHSQLLTKHTGLVRETVSHQDWDYVNTALADEYSSSEFDIASNDLHNYRSEPEENIRKRQATSSSSSESSEEKENTKFSGYTNGSDSSSNESTGTSSGSTEHL